MKRTHDHSELQFYYREIKRFPVLTHEEEYELAKRYQNGDAEAGQQMIHANLRFVVKVSSKYFNSGYHHLEIIQEGNLGLIRALKRFDPERGVPFVYYAVWWIEATIKAFLLKSRKVHTGNLGHAKDLLSLDENIGNDENDRDQWIDFLTDGADPEKIYRGEEATRNITGLFQQCIDALPERDARVIMQRFFADPPVKLKDIGEQLGVSRERVRQLQVRSMEKLRLVLEGMGSHLSEAEAHDFCTFEANSRSSSLLGREYQN